MRGEAELCWGAALLAHWGVGALGQVRLRVRVLPLGLLLLLLEAGQAEEEAEDGFQITIPDLCVSGRRTVVIIIIITTQGWGAGARLTFSRQTLGVDSFGRQEGEAGIDVLNLHRETQRAVRRPAFASTFASLMQRGQPLLIWQAPPPDGKMISENCGTNSTKEHEK